MKVTELRHEVFLPAEQRMREFGMNVQEIKKECSFAIQILNDPKNSYLATSTKESIMKSVVNIASIGLTLNPVAKEAYLIPRKKKIGNEYLVECHLEPSYIGLIKLITNAGSVSNIQTNLVYENDEFNIIYGLNTDFRHIPLFKGSSGNIVGVYSVATLHNGEKQFEYMNREQVEVIREHSESWLSFLKAKDKAEKDPKASGTVRTPIWITDEGEMFRKTCLKRMSKYLPRSGDPQHKQQLQYMNSAIKLADKDWEPSLHQIQYAESLINSCTLLDSKKESLLRELPTCRAADIELMIDYLTDNQPNAIESADVHSEGQIGDAVDNAILRDKDPELI